MPEVDVQRIGILGHHDTHNFGDVLLAELCADAIQEGGGRPDFLFGCGESETSGTVRKLRGLRRSFRCAGLVLGGGGYLEAPGRAVLTNLLPLSAAVALIRARRRPIGIFGAGTGAANGPLAKILLRYICAAASPVVIRDRQSVECLQRVGVREHVSVLSDLANAASIRGRYRKMLGAERCSAEKTLLVHVDNLFLLGDKYPQAEFIVEALKSFKIPRGWTIKILFDYIKDEALTATLGKAIGCRVISGANVPAVLKEIASAAVVVSGKFHVALIALSLGKPTLGISPHAKVADLFSSLRISELHRGVFWSVAEARRLLDEAVATELPLHFEEIRRATIIQAVALYDLIAQFAERCCSQAFNAARTR